MVRVISFGLHSDGLPQIAFWNAESGPWSSPICGCQGDVHFMVAVRCDGERMAEGLRCVREDSRMLYVRTQIRPAAMQQPEWGGHRARCGPDSSVWGVLPAGGMLAQCHACLHGVWVRAPGTSCWGRCGPVGAAACSLGPPRRSSIEPDVITRYRSGGIADCRCWPMHII